MKSSSDLHKNEPGAFVVTCYSPIGRKKGYTLKENLTDAQKFANRWKRMGKGSAVVHRCLYNTELCSKYYTK